MRCISSFLLRSFTRLIGGLEWNSTKIRKEYVVHRTSRNVSAIIISGRILLSDAVINIKEIPNAITNAGSIRRFVENIFYGWGYNAYRKENQLRADDLLIRSRLSDLLGQCREAIRQREMDWRREHLPPPTREHPFPDKSAVQEAKGMESFGKKIEAVEVRIRTASVPENDRVWQRHRNESETLAKLAQVDLEMAESIIQLLQYCSIKPVSELDTQAIECLLDKRSSILSIF